MRTVLPSLLLAGVALFSGVGCDRSPQDAEVPGAVSEWSPPPKPNPTEILQSAKADQDAGRFADALAKHLWFHRQALTHDPGQYGVRLSFGLSYWADLGRKYPPALEELKKVRDEAEARWKQGAGGRDEFNEIEAINKVLGSHDRTVAVFAHAEQHQPERAKQVYDLAQPALIRTGDYRRCGKYLHPDVTGPELIRELNDNLHRAADPRFGERMKQFAHHRFTYATTTMAALLVRNDRVAEADGFIRQMKEVVDDPGYHEALEIARKGTVPAAWP